jgi:hypothetical protein
VAAVVPSPRIARRRDQVLTQLLTMLTINDDIFRPVELAHLEAAVCAAAGDLEDTP